MWQFSFIFTLSSQEIYRPTGTWNQFYGQVANLAWHGPKSTPKVLVWIQNITKPTTNPHSWTNFHVRFDKGCLADGKARDEIRWRPCCQISSVFCPKCREFWHCIIRALFTHFPKLEAEPTHSRFGAFSAHFRGETNRTFVKCLCDHVTKDR